MSTEPTSPSQYGQQAPVAGSASTVGAASPPPPPQLSQPLHAAPLTTPAGVPAPTFPTAATATVSGDAPARISSATSPQIGSASGSAVGTSRSDGIPRAASANPPAAVPSVATSTSAPGPASSSPVTATSSGTIASGNIALSANSATTRRYRVPDDLRRRAAVSCDRCKLRRARCVRADGEEDCSNCIRHNSACVSTLPRKHRIYGSLESLSLRFRALEALVRGLFPDENTADVATLFKIAAERNVGHLMPNPEGVEFASQIFDSKPASAGANGQAVMAPARPGPKSGMSAQAPSGGDARSAGTGSDPTPLSAFTSVSPASHSPLGPQSQLPCSLPPGAKQDVFPTAAMPGVADSVGGATAATAALNTSSTSIPTTSADTASATAPVPIPSFVRPPLTGPAFPTSSIEEQLVATPQGWYHYIGPTSTFGFAAHVRAIVGRCALAPGCRLYRRDVGAALAQLHSLTAGNKGARPCRTVGYNVPTQGQQAPLQTQAQSQTRAQARGPLPTVKKESGEGQDTRKRKRSDQTANLSPSAGLSSPGGGFKDTSRANLSPNRSAVRNLLPAREDADELVKAYFEYVHPTSPIFLRSWFEQAYGTFWDDTPSDGNPSVPPASALSPKWRDDPGLMCCIVLVLLFGADAYSQHTKRNICLDRRMASQLIRTVLLSKLLLSSCLINTQALYLLHIYEHNAGERNLSWVLLGAATRMAMGIGMHRNLSASAFNRTEYEVRKRVWWTLYLSENLMSVIIGRPSIILDSEVTVPMPDESFFGDENAPPAFLEHAIRLVRILGSIRAQVYGPVAAAKSALPDSERVRHHLNVLDHWHDSLPPMLLPKWNSMRPCHRRAVLLLHLYYTFARCLVTRPFYMRKVEAGVVELERKVGSDINSERGDGTVSSFTQFTALLSLPPSVRSDIMSLAKVCLRSAEHAASILLQLTNSGLFDGASWFDGYYVYHSIFILALDVLLKPQDVPEGPDERAHKAVMKSVMQAVHKFTLGTTFKLILHVTAQLVAAIEAPAVSAQETVPGAGLGIGSAHYTKTTARRDSGGGGLQIVPATDEDQKQSKLDEARRPDQGCAAPRPVAKPALRLSNPSTLSSSSTISSSSSSVPVSGVKSGTGIADGVTDDVQIVQQPATLDVFPAAYVAAPWDYFHLFTVPPAGSAHVPVPIQLGKQVRVEVEGKPGTAQNEDDVEDSGDAKTTEDTNVTGKPLVSTLLKYHLKAERTSGQDSGSVPVLVSDMEAENKQDSRDFAAAGPVSDGARSELESDIGVVSQEVNHKQLVSRQGQQQPDGQLLAHSQTHNGLQESSIKPEAEPERDHQAVMHQQPHGFSYNNYQQQHHQHHEPMLQAGSQLQELQVQSQPQSRLHLEGLGQTPPGFLHHQNGGQNQHHTDPHHLQRLHEENHYSGFTHNFGFTAGPGHTLVPTSVPVVFNPQHLHADTGPQGPLPMPMAVSGSAPGSGLGPGTSTSIFPPDRFAALAPSIPFELSLAERGQQQQPQSGNLYTSIQVDFDVDAINAAFARAPGDFESFSQQLHQPTYNQHAYLNPPTQVSISASGPGPEPLPMQDQIQAPTEDIARRGTTMPPLLEPTQLALQLPPLHTLLPSQPAHGHHHHQGISPSLSSPFPGYHGNQQPLQKQHHPQQNSDHNSHLTASLEGVISKSGEGPGSRSGLGTRQEMGPSDSLILPAGGECGPNGGGVESITSTGNFHPNDKVGINNDLPTGTGASSITDGRMPAPSSISFRAPDNSLNGPISLPVPMSMPVPEGIPGAVGLRHEYMMSPNTGPGTSSNAGNPTESGGQMPTFHSSQRPDYQTSSETQYGHHLNRPPPSYSYFHHHQERPPESEVVCDHEHEVGHVQRLRHLQVTTNGPSLESGTALGSGSGPLPSFISQTQEMNGKGDVKEDGNWSTNSDQKMAGYGLNVATTDVNLGSRAADGPLDAGSLSVDFHPGDDGNVDVVMS